MILYIDNDYFSKQNQFVVLRNGDGVFVAVVKEMSALYPA
jgi:hypothetical protein